MLPEGANEDKSGSDDDNDDNGSGKVYEGEKTEMFFNCYVLVHYGNNLLTLSLVVQLQ